MPACIHCERTLKGYSPRGLCWVCYRTPHIKAAYPQLKRGPKGPRSVAPVKRMAIAPAPTASGEPTAEEVAAFADWWEAEQERLERRPELPRVATVRAEGCG